MGTCRKRRVSVDAGAQSVGMRLSTSTLRRDSAASTIRARDRGSRVLLGEANRDSICIAGRASGVESKDPERWSRPRIQSFRHAVEL